MALTKYYANRSCFQLLKMTVKSIHRWEDGTDDYFWITITILLTFDYNIYYPFVITMSVLLLVSFMYNHCETIIKYMTCPFNAIYNCEALVKMAANKRKAPDDMRSTGSTLQNHIDLVWPNKQCARWVTDVNMCVKVCFGWGITWQWEFLMFYI